jgi:hypothetical protein
MKNESSPIKHFGKVGTLWLNSIGIFSLEALGNMGSIEAYKRIKEIHHDANILMLYAMEAALWDLPWNQLPPELKEMLQEQVGYQPRVKLKKK